jgi:hypothetical protein
MTARHDEPVVTSDTHDMEPLDRLEQQATDLRALKETSELRQTLTRGSPEWLQALRKEDGLITRLLAWVGKRPGDLRAE